MTLTSHVSETRRRTTKIVLTILAGLIVLFVANAARPDAQESATALSTQSVLGVTGTDALPPTAIPTTAVPTTAPLLVPTATPEPTPTSTPAPTATTVPPTAVPTATAEPTPEPTPEAAVAAASSAEISSADAEPQATEPAAAPATDVSPTAVPEPTATAIPEPTATPEPTPTPDIVIEVTPTAEPTPEPTPTPVPVQTVADLEAYVLGKINGVRANAGLGPLALDPSISLISRDWSQQMATGGFFDHRPGDQLNVMLPAGWRQWGENIASAPDIEYAQSSLEASPGHYANMVGPFTHVGIGVYTTGRQVWVTQNFARYEG